VTCASSSVYLWSINGRLLADLTFPEGPKSRIQCCAVSELCEWDSQNVILTGGIDGVVRVSLMFCLVYTFYSLQSNKHECS
jgi:hypothetical protein